MASCKKCGSEKAVKSGIVGGRQRFRCKNCGYHFRLDDNRTNQKTAAKKALCILWYLEGRDSYRMMGKLIQIKHTLIHRWIHKYRENLPEPHVFSDINQLAFDEIAAFVGLKKENYELLKQLIDVHKKQLPESLVSAILPCLDNTTIK